MAAFTNPPLRSIECYRKYGCTRSVVSHILTRNFYIPAMWQDTLESYYVLYWSPHYLVSQIKNGEIVRENKKYVVVWHGCTPEQAYHAKQVILSFREPKVEFSLPAYVLIALPRSA